jgi:hypothetical protein
MIERVTLAVRRKLRIVERVLRAPTRDLDAALVQLQPNHAVYEPLGVHDVCRQVLVER